MPSSRELLMADFANFHEDLQRVLEVADDVSVWPIFDRERDDRWSGDHIVLLGDACHPMRPYMAAGGAMAIEDGAILSRCLEKFGDPAEAFGWYTATRISRCSRTTHRSKTAGCVGRPRQTGSTAMTLARRS